MGIKPTYIKTMGSELIEKHKDRLSRDFEENKQAVAELALIGSKRVRNRVAGNITRKLNRRKHA